MENKKKMIFNVLFLFLVFAATLYGVFHGEDLSEIAEILKTVNLYWLLPGVACVIIFIWGESIIIFYMMHTLGIHLKKWKCFLFSSVGFFFSCITPSATGGQPAQIYYMKKEKIPIPVSTLVLMIVTITYKMVLVVIGLGLMIFGRGFIRTHMYEIRHIFLSWNRFKCVLCGFYAAPCISSGACTFYSCERNGTAGKNASDAT